MSRHGIKNYTSGQSLLEAVVAVGLVIVIATALISATTTGLKNSQSGKLRSKAVVLAQDGLELSRKLRDNGWGDFQTYGTALGKAWCLDSLGQWTVSTGPCPLDIDSPYTRMMTFTWDSANSRMKVNSVVSWNERSQVKDVTLTTYFTDWR